MSSMLVHCGGEMCDLDGLREPELPEETRTYKPVAHYDLALNIGNVADDMFTGKGYRVDKQQYALAREGQRLFGLLTYRNGNDDMGLAVGFRNSYDKSMSAGIAVGARVFVCDNLALTGEVCTMRKHTKNVQDDLMDSVVQALFRSVSNFQTITEDLSGLKGFEISDDEGYEMLGRLVGRDVLKPTIFNVAMREWQKPKHEEFQPRTPYSLYNAVTEALKKAPPDRVFESHIATHKEFKENWLTS